MESFLAFEFFIKLYYFLVASFSSSFATLSKTSLKRRRQKQVNVNVKTHLTSELCTKKGVQYRSLQTLFSGLSVFCAKVLNVKYRLCSAEKRKKPTHFSKSFHSQGNFSQLLCRVALKTSSFLNYLVFHTFFLQPSPHTQQTRKKECVDSISPFVLLSLIKDPQKCLLPKRNPIRIKGK